MVKLKMSKSGVVYHEMGITILLILGVTGSGKAAEILCVAPFPATSHFRMVEPLLLELSRRGHNVTVLSHFPQKEKIENYTDVDLRGMLTPYELEFKPFTLLDDALDLFGYGLESCEVIASSDTIRNLFETENKFDLVIIEAFVTDCLLGVVARLGTPFISFVPMALPVWESDWIYNPIEAAYLPDIICRLSGKMSFYERLKNVGCQLMFRVLNWLQNSKPTVEVARKYLNLSVNSFDDLKRNVSLIMVNSFHGLTGVRPLFPNVLEIGGIHLKPPRPLPKNIEKFCNESTGVIIFSMGSIVKAHTLSPTIKAEILSVISNLEEGVIWKWEEEIPNKPENLMVLPWLPQSDILGHPKVKLFISHGGIHGLYEAIYNGVPIIGIPLFGDQYGNLKALEFKGSAVVIDFPELSGKTLSSAINKILGNDRLNSLRGARALLSDVIVPIVVKGLKKPALNGENNYITFSLGFKFSVSTISYRTNAELLSRIFRDQPQTPLDKAVFWTEYVIRHGGAPHFQTGASQLSWLQHALIDVIFFCVSFIIVTIAGFYYSLKIFGII